MSHSTQFNPTAIPISRRLVGRYMAFGLGGLLLCLITMLSLTFQGGTDSLLSLAAVGPAAVLVVGAVVVLLTVRRNSAIEQQLRRIATASTEELAIRPLPGNDAVAAGWNTLIDRVSTQDAWRRIEDRLADSVGQLHQDRLEAVFRQIPVAIAVTDLGGNVIQANHAFLGLIGGQRLEELIGEPFANFIDFATAHNAAEIEEAVSRQAASITFEMQRGATLDTGVLHLTRTSLRRADDGPARHLWTIRDVTQQLLAQEMRDQFVFTATHELRTPLTNIKAYAETLAIEEGIDVEQQKQFCNIINEEATRLSRFVDELLNISQMEAGSLALHRYETDLEALIGDVIRHVRPEMDHKQIDFNMDLPAKWPKLELDKDKLTSAVINLLGNAAKYTQPEGRVTLQVKVSDAEIDIHVEDTGMGIAEEERGRIFEKFFRSQDERVRQLTGNGLGLAFTQEVARLHGGRLSVHSELNKGSRFTLTLPRN